MQCLSWERTPAKQAAEPRLHDSRWRQNSKLHWKTLRYFPLHRIAVVLQILNSVIFAALLQRPCAHTAKPSESQRYPPLQLTTGSDRFRIRVLRITVDWHCSSRKQRGWIQLCEQLGHHFSVHLVSAFGSPPVAYPYLVFLFCGARMMCHECIMIVGHCICSSVTSLFTAHAVQHVLGDKVAVAVARIGACCMIAPSWCSEQSTLWVSLAATSML